MHEMCNVTGLRTDLMKEPGKPKSGNKGRYEISNPILLSMRLIRLNPQHLVIGEGNKVLNREVFQRPFVGHGWRLRRR